MNLTNLYKNNIDIPILKGLYTIQETDTCNSKLNSRFENTFTIKVDLNLFNRYIDILKNKRTVILEVFDSYLYLYLYNPVITKTEINMFTRFNTATIVVCCEHFKIVPMQQRGVK